MLRLDGVTAIGTRAIFERLCIRFDLRKPLVIWVWIEGIGSKYFQYEGIYSLMLQSVARWVANVKLAWS